MTTDITITIETDYLPHLYGIVMREQKSYEGFLTDENLKKFPSLYELAERHIRNLSEIKKTLVDAYIS